MAEESENRSALSEQRQKLKRHVAEEDIAI